MAKNMIFSKEIWIFLIFLGIPEAQIPQKQRFWPSGRGYYGQKVLKIPENWSNIGFRAGWSYCLVRLRQRQFQAMAREATLPATSFQQAI